MNDGDVAEETKADGDSLSDDDTVDEKPSAFGMFYRSPRKKKDYQASDFASTLDPDEAVGDFTISPRKGVYDASASGSFASPRSTQRSGMSPRKGPTPYSPRAMKSSSRDDSIPVSGGGGFVPLSMMGEAFMSGEIDDVEGDGSETSDGLEENKSSRASKNIYSAPFKQPSMRSSSA
jgi:hypothetical protein